jgi:uncharacterized protein YegP (UPF0339 family)
MAGKFEIYTDAAGKDRFRLKAGNGEVIATGEAYESKASAKKRRVGEAERADAMTIAASPSAISSTHPRQSSEAAKTDDLQYVRSCSRRRQTAITRIRFAHRLQGGRQGLSRIVSTVALRCRDAAGLVRDQSVRNRAHMPSAAASCRPASA